MNDPAFIEAVNLAYHEEEAAAYDGRHPEIFQEEVRRWDRVREAVAGLKRRLGRPIRLLDIGTGTGFVPRQLAPVLSPEDESVLTDMSPAMLDRCRQALAEARFPAKTTYVVGAASSLEADPVSFDVVTMNSVVHHFPDPAAVFRGVDRALRPGGLVVISHEPNALHFRHPIVGSLDRSLRLLRSLRGLLRGADSGSGNPFIDRVNQRLIAAGIVSAPLSAEKIESVVDIHSPTAGRTVRSERGFAPLKLAAESFSGYAVRLLLTYQHFGKVHLEKMKALAPVTSWIERTWPDAGALFLLILQKPEKPPAR